MEKKIVVIEDDTSIQEMLGIYFQKHGLTVIAANDGKAGLDLIKKHKPSAVVVDIQLPKMNGYEICSICQTDQALKDIPIMVITGLTSKNTAAEDETWRQKLSVADFMSKPFEPQELTDRILKMIGNGD